MRLFVAQVSILTDPGYKFCTSRYERFDYAEPWMWCTLIQLGSADLCEEEGLRVARWIREWRNDDLGDAAQSSAIGWIVVCE
jgi:hypothetical protein